MLVIGNSIAHHVPADVIGWKGDWGMAASRQENDWVHLVAKYISNDQGKDVGIHILSHTKFPRIYTERTQEEQRMLDNSQLIFIQVGDNMIDDSYENFESLYRGLLNFLAKNTSAPIFFLTTWRYPDNQPNARRIIKRLSEEYGLAFIDITGLSDDISNRAESEAICQDPNLNRAVCWHPGDMGMKRIAFEVCHQGHASKYDEIKGELVLEDILVGGEHYSMLLRNEGNYSFSMVNSSLLASHQGDSQSAIYDKASQSMRIPHLYGLHQYFQILLEESKDSLKRFNLESAKKSTQ